MSTTYHGRTVFSPRPPTARRFPQRRAVTIPDHGEHFCAGPCGQPLPANAQAMHIADNNTVWCRPCAEQTSFHFFLDSETRVREMIGEEVGRG